MAIEETDGITAGLVSPLMFAVMLNRLPIVDLLLGARLLGARPTRRTADVNWARPHNNVTSVLLAARRGHAEVVSLLIEHGAHIETARNDGSTPACAAAEKGHAEVVRVLAQHGANLEAQEDDAYTPAYIAAQEGHAGVLRVLSELGANLEAQDTIGVSQ